MSVSESIRILRGKFLLTQDAFAKELGVSSATVNRWETEKAMPNISAMRAIKSFCEKNEYPYNTIESGWLKQRAEGKK